MNWKNGKIGDFLSVQQGLQIKKDLRKTEKEEGYIPLLKITDLQNKSFGEFVTKIPTQNIATKEDIIYTRTGIVGDVYTDLEGCIHNNCFKIIYDKSKFYKMYLYYYFKQPWFKKMAYNSASGSVQKDLGHPAFKSLPFSFPIYEEQKEIGDKISVYDDKIENNSKIINTLEEMASLLYKRYFVDFEFPNKEGKPYKSNGGEFKDSEIGLIPIEWNNTEAKELLNFVTGFEPGGNSYVEKKISDEYVQFFRVKDLNEKQEIYIKKAIIKKDNNVTKNEVLVSFDGTIGRVAVGYDGCYSSGMKKIVSKHSNITNAYIYFYMKSDKTQNILKEHATGTTILHASKSIEYLNILYSQEVMEEFNTIVVSMYEMILNKKEENELLVTTRDLLINELIK